MQPYRTKFDDALQRRWCPDCSFKPRPRPRPGPRPSTESYGNHPGNHGNPRNHGNFAKVAYSAENSKVQPYGSC